MAHKISWSDRVTEDELPECEKEVSERVYAGFMTKR